MNTSHRNSIRRSLPLVVAVLACVVSAGACGLRDGEVIIAAERATTAVHVGEASAPFADAGRPDEQPTPQISNSLPLKLPLDRPRILVLKAKRQLILFEGERALRLYRVGLGTAPVGDKEREGDRRTPEGDFYVCVKNARSNFLVSLGLSYPNEEDAERGLRTGLITRRQHAAIVRANRRRQTPSWKTALGGEIFIHGNGSQSDWTWGCVALDDKEMQELFDAVPLGTPVTIKP